MSVRFVRTGAAGLALGLALALTGSAPAQSVDWKRISLPIDPIVGNDFIVLNDLQFGRVSVEGPDLAKNQKYLKKSAREIVYKATQPSYYELPVTGDLKARTDEQNFDTVITALDGRLVVPTPANSIERIEVIRKDYVNEFGKALDEALTQVFAIPGLPPIARTNAARVLATAAKSGAPVHGKMIRAMLTNQYFKKDGKPVETPPEVLLHALKAAGNLLAAYDLNNRGGGAAESRHTLPEAELLPFVQALMDLVVKGPDVAAKAAAPVVDPFGNVIAVPADAPPAPGATPPAPGVAPPAAAGKLDAKGLTPEQTRLVIYFRREAVRALAQCRFDILGGRGGSADIRPGFTLAQVAVNDAALSLPATPAEAAEAVIGLCGMNPSGELDPGVLVAAVAGGVRNLAAPRVASADDKSLPWKLTAARVGQAVTRLKAASNVTTRLKPVERQTGELADLVVADVTGPLGRDAAGGAVSPNVNQLNNWLANNAPWLATTAPANSTKLMYPNSPPATAAAFTLRPRAPGQ